MPTQRSLALPHFKHPLGCAGLPRPSSAPVGMWRQGAADSSSAGSTPPRTSPPAPSSTMGASQVCWLAPPCVWLSGAVLECIADSYFPRALLNRAGPKHVDHFTLPSHISHDCCLQSGAGSPWGSAGAGSSASLLSDSTELAAMQQDGSPSEGRQSQVAAQPVEQQQQQQTAQQQRTSAEQAPQQQLQPVPETAAAAASADGAQRRQAHVPGQVHVTLKVHPRRQMQTVSHGICGL